MYDGVPRMAPERVWAESSSRYFARPKSVILGMYSAACGLAESPAKRLYGKPFFP